ncbi:hypothetical protein [Micromonospora sp. WMMD737]|uniref:hypothetical protein n=1 Tax=Micromonospora sp. WMMD737 TaxID=3404113 RepID=UPI003B94ADDC
MGGGKTAAVAQVIAEATRPAGHSAGDLEELLIAVRAGRVVAIGSRWVIDVSWLARAAIDAGLTAKVGVEDQARLKLTTAGRVTVSRLCADRVLAEAKRIARAHRRGRERAEQEHADRVAAQGRQSTRSAVGAALFGLGMFAAGAATTYLALRPTGR